MRAFLPWLASALLLVSGGYQLGVATHGLMDDTWRRDLNAAFDQAIGLAEDAQALAASRDDELVKCANMIVDSDAAVKQIGAQAMRYVRECSASIDAVTFSRDWCQEECSMTGISICDGSVKCEPSGYGGYTLRGAGAQSPPLNREEFYRWRKARYEEAKKKWPGNGVDLK